MLNAACLGLEQRPTPADCNGGTARNWAVQHLTRTEPEGEFTLASLKLGDPISTVSKGIATWACVNRHSALECLRTGEQPIDGFLDFYQDRLWRFGIEPTCQERGWQQMCGEYAEWVHRIAAVLGPPSVERAALCAAPDEAKWQTACAAWKHGNDLLIVSANRDAHDMTRVDLSVALDRGVARCPTEADDEEDKASRPEGDNGHSPLR
jgi:hypothetical protein